MENNRPRGRERHVSGPGKKVEKHGKGLGSGPVGRKLKITENEKYTL